MQQKIIILDFGSQTTQLIGRRLRELDTFCEIVPYNCFPHDDPDVIGVKSIELTANQCFAASNPLRCKLRKKTTNTHTNMYRKVEVVAEQQKRNSKSQQALT